MWPFLKFCKLVEKFISSVPCGAKYWCKKVVVNKVMVQMGIPSTKSTWLNANWQNWAWQEKKLKWGDYLTHINMYWQGFGLGTTRKQIQARSEWVWAAKYCQFANNSINLVINHIWAISLSFFGPTRNRDFWKKVINT